jgi:hypothetical protein
MPKYRKKGPKGADGLVEAVQLTWDNWEEACDFVRVPHGGRGSTEYLPEVAMEVDTPLGSVIVRENHWILRDVGSVHDSPYACTPGMFERTYERVGE